MIIDNFLHQAVKLECMKIITIAFSEKIKSMKHMWKKEQQYVAEELHTVLYFWYKEKKTCFLEIYSISNKEGINLGVVQKEHSLLF